MGARVSDIADALPGRPAEDPPPRSHIDIVRGVAEGQAWANAALYDALCPMVLRALQRIVRDPNTDYDDLVQTTFERIVRALVDKSETSVSNLSGWAVGVATHVALDALRVRIRERRLFSHDDAAREATHSAVGPSLERQVEARRKLAWVQEALVRMNTEQARTLLLHDVMGHDLAEIAAIMGVSVAAAQKRLWRARQDLLQRAKRRSPRGEP